VKDPNGNTNTLRLLPGGGLYGQAPRVLTEFHADTGKKSTGYDVFGDARVLTDEEQRVTLQEFDKVGRVNAEQMEREGALVTRHPLLIQKTMADKLSDKIQVIIAPPSENGFIGASLLGAGKK